MKGVIKFVIGYFSPKGVHKSVIKTFFLKGVIKFVIGRFYLKGDDKFVKKKARFKNRYNRRGQQHRYNEIGTKNKVKTKNNFFLKGVIKFVIGRFFLKGDDKFVKKKARSKNRYNRRGQQHGYNEIGTKNRVKIKNNFFLKGVIKFVIGRFFLKGDDKFVKKKRRGPKIGKKIGTIREVNIKIRKYS